MAQQQILAMESSFGDSWDGNKRIKSHDEEDRISALPDSVLQLILSLLPSTREAIRTSILSKRRRNQWTRVPVLIFNASRKSGDKHFRFIENTLILHDCPKIKKFHLHYGYGCKAGPLFTSKIQFAIRKCVEELILICCYNLKKSNLLPKFLLDSASLVKLEVVDCYFMPNLRVNWPSLKSLKLDFSSLGYDTNFSQGIENVVSGSPLPEWLEIRGICLQDQVTIVSKSLKVLTFVYMEVVDVFRIICPNLVELNIDQSTFPDQMIESVLSDSLFIHSLKLAHCKGYYAFEKIVIASESLKELHLDYVMVYEIEVSCPNLEKLDMLCGGDVVFKALNLPSSVCATLDYIEPSDFTEKELLEQFQHAKLGKSAPVCPLNALCQLLFISELDVEDRELLPMLNSKCLAMNVGAHFGLALPGIAYAHCSPTLETLVVKLNSKCHKNALDQRFKELIISIFDYWNSNKSTGDTCLESHLKTGKIIGLYEDDDNCKFVLEFIEFILKNARVLEKMVVLLEKSRKDYVIEVSQKLLSFSRYPQLANVEFLCST